MYFSGPPSRMSSISSHSCSSRSVGPRPSASAAAAAAAAARSAAAASVVAWAPAGASCVAAGSAASPTYTSTSSPTCSASAAAMAEASSSVAPSAIRTLMGVGCARRLKPFPLPDRSGTGFAGRSEIRGVDGQFAGCVPDALARSVAALSGVTKKALGALAVAEQDILRSLRSLRIEPAQATPFTASPPRPFSPPGAILPAPADPWGSPATISGPQTSPRGAGGAGPVLTFVRTRPARTRRHALPCRGIGPVAAIPRRLVDSFLTYKRSFLSYKPWPRVASRRVPRSETDPPVGGAGDHFWCRREPQYP